MHSRFRARWRDDHGSVTAEFAIALPAVVLVLGACLSGVHVAGQQLRLQDAAAGAARALARGEGAAAAASLAARLAPGASLENLVDGDLVCARLSVGAPFGITLHASSCALGGGL